MNYSENEKRRNMKRRKRRHFVAWLTLFLIGLSVGIIFVSGIIHLFWCKGCLTVEATASVPEEVVSPVAVTVPAEPEVQRISLGEFKLTAYCPCTKCCGKCDGITASGIRAKEGVTVAADPKVLPLGTRIIIDGHEYIVQDTGSAIKGNKIDVYFESHQEALEFGVQYKEIFVMKEGEMI